MKTHPRHRLHKFNRIPPLHIQPPPILPPNRAHNPRTPLRNSAYCPVVSISMGEGGMGVLRVLGEDRTNEMVGKTNW